tara:strand:- start:110 stop:1321 length:1212 start_codon:yes stop_codon:yes gene_type:complete
MSRRVNDIDNPYFTYVDIELCNNNVNNLTGNPIPLVFNTLRDADYIQNPSQYFLGVARWSLDLRLPIIIPEINFAFNNGNYSSLIGGYQTTYSITLQIKTSTNMKESQKYINFVPQHYNLKPPTAPLTNMIEVYDNRYFYIESVQYWILLVNDCFKRAWEDVRAQWLTDIGALPIADVQPFIQYNYDGNCTLLATVDYYEEVPLVNGRGQIFFNSAMNTLFNGFTSIVVGFNNSLTPVDSTNGKNYYIQIIDTNQKTTINSVNMPYMITEYPVVPFWSPISSIVFQSASIPVEATNVNPVQISDTANSLGGNRIGSNNINLSSIITDFQIDANVGTEQRQITYYAPEVYRWFDLNSNRPLSAISIIVMWKDKLIGGLHQMYLYPTGSGTVKLVFRRKDYYNAM